jgi:hypothetical protein
MLALFLAGWTALSGASGFGKLGKEWVVYCQSRQAMSQQPEIDWTTYYRNIGSHTNPVGPGRINYAPVFTSPILQWAVPNSCLNGPPGPAYGTMYGSPDR